VLVKLSEVLMLVTLLKHIHLDLSHHQELKYSLCNLRISEHTFSKKFVWFSLILRHVAESSFSMQPIFLVHNSSFTHK